VKHAVKLKKIMEAHGYGVGVVTTPSPRTADPDNVTAFAHRGKHFVLITLEADDRLMPVLDAEAIRLIAEQVLHHAEGHPQ
jgi:hypothetical protein